LVRFSKNGKLAGSGKFLNADFGDSIEAKPHERSMKSIHEVYKSQR
jgi:hypothetical protein